MCFRRVLLFIVACTALGVDALPATPTPTAGAAFLAYEKADYAGAAAIFAQVLEDSRHQLGRDEAEYGLALSLKKAGFALASLRAFEALLSRGSSNPYFVRALEGLVEAGEEANGGLLVSQLLERFYDPKAAAWRSLQPKHVQRIYYWLALRAFRAGKVEDARRFAQKVEAGHEEHGRAQYLLGATQKNLGDARKNFAAAEESSDAQLRSMGRLALARLDYEEGLALTESDPRRAALLQQAIAQYETVPRFSAHWSAALLEMAWAYSALKDEGRALGLLQAFEHPALERSLSVHAELLRAHDFWRNCQWGEVNQTLLRLKEKSPAAQRNEKALQVFASLLKQLESEEALARASKALAQTTLLGDMLASYARWKQDVRVGAERSDAQAAKHRASEREWALVQAELISFETKVAEAKWLGKGRSLAGHPDLNGVAARVLQEGQTFWHGGNDEQWLDELGYLRYAMRSQCDER